ncbi:MAG: hypothetical protein KAJ19_18360, partial [Gammaproteobacteria bacterium]|nr:hypothetical protein [Gammaproteobacteria bacterium]
LRVFVEESATVLISKTASTILGVLLLSWHAADVASSFTLAGSLVDQWRDISGNGHHVDQAGVLRPEYDTAESHGISLNGRNGVWFTPAQYLLGTTTPVTAAGFYVWCAATSDDTTVFTLLCSFADTGTVNNSWVLFLFGPTGGDPALWEAQAGATFSDVLTTNGYSANTVHVARVHEAAVNDHRIALDGGTEATEATPVAPSGVDRMGIGVNARGAGAPLDPQFNSNGYVLEVAVANATGITPQQVSDMDVLTAFKWGAATP